MSNFASFENAGVLTGKGYSLDPMKELIAGLLLIEGTGIIVFSQIMRNRALSRIQSFRKTQGQVIEVQETRGNKGGLIKTPVVRYQGMNGEMVTFINKFGSSNWKIQPGEMVDVLVNPNDPEDAEVVNPMGQFGVSRILTVAGAMSYILAVGVYFFWDHLN